MNQDYYTVFYNDEEQMELEKRTDLNRVDVDKSIWKNGWSRRVVSNG